ncbi:Dyp-type peroxidase [Kitasatospora viridis]|uniref:Dyp-type peroxidase family n=1 Tax=Kitasatospora viridis TaxID=281105 RepID=A0A561T6Z9_9ACTN|nr:Dyp-type peroxidase [Kitasatospora viridis]TWF82891.1 Dyp-type peroxidase family [Kitasatospora viridis]
MPVDLPLRENEDIQGDVLAGFKKDQMVLLLLTFGDPLQARAWLRRLTPRIATTRQVATFNQAFSDARKRSGGDPSALRATWLGVSFTYHGLAKLIGKAPYPQADATTTLGAFQQGPVVRADAMGDRDDSHPSRWLFGNNKTEEQVHAVLTIASDGVEDLQGAITEQRELAARYGLSIVFEQHGATLKGSRRGKEHFGFKDGVSEPGVTDFDEPDPLMPEWVKDHPGTRLIPAGEFVVGHPTIDDTPEALPAWAVNGSFQVVRRLAQDVPGWWAQIARQLPVLKKAKAIPDDATVEWVAARVVGRWRSGTPVATCPNADQPFNTVAANDNKISYLNDLEGHVTPLFSHLRKTNPRDGLQEHPGDKPFDEKPVMDRRRIIRRGSPYGAPFDPASEGPGGPDESRGLLFVCYQRELVRQFEFIQNRWIDNSDFPPNRPNKPGPDAMVGFDGAVDWERDGGDPVQLSFQRFVRTEGAVYAFLPSLTMLNALQEGRLPGEVPPSGQPVDTFLPVPDRQRVDGKSWYWAYRTVAGEQRYRAISIADGNAHTDKLEKPDRPIADWDSFAGVTRLDCLLPFPDGQNVGGKSTYWLFHAGPDRQRYRVVSIADGNAHTDELVRVDGDLSLWRSLDGVAAVDFFLPIPELQRQGGKSWYWVFHTLNGEQLYRIITIADGTRHEDTLIRGDRRLSAWDSFAGIDRITTVLPIPDMQRVNGKCWYWVFHQDQYRIVSIEDHDNHDDRIEVPDRSISLWSSLTSG